MVIDLKTFAIEAYEAQQAELRRQEKEQTERMYREDVAALEARIKAVFAFPTLFVPLELYAYIRATDREGGKYFPVALFRDFSLRLVFRNIPELLLVSTTGGTAGKENLPVYVYEPDAGGINSLEDLGRELLHVEGRKERERERKAEKEWEDIVDARLKREIGEDEFPEPFEL